MVAIREYTSTRHPVYTCTVTAAYHDSTAFCQFFTCTNAVQRLHHAFQCFYLCSVGLVSGTSKLPAYQCARLPGLTVNYFYHCPRFNAPVVTHLYFVSKTFLKSPQTALKDHEASVAAGDTPPGLHFPF